MESDCFSSFFRLGDGEPDAGKRWSAGQPPAAGLAAAGAGGSPWAVGSGGDGA